MADETKQTSCSDEKLTAMESFKLFVWDPEKKAFLGRNGTSWCEYFLRSF